MRKGVKELKDFFMIIFLMFAQFPLLLALFYDLLCELAYWLTHL